MNSHETMSVNMYCQTLLKCSISARDKKDSNSGTWISWIYFVLICLKKVKQYCVFGSGIFLMAGSTIFSLSQNHCHTNPR